MTSLAWVSGILISALRRLGSATRARLVAGSDVLADFHRNDLKNAAEAGADVEGVEFTLLEIVKSALLIDFGLLGLDPSAGGVLGVFGAIVFELEANGELLFLDSGKLLGDVRADALLVELLSTSC